MGAGGTGAPSTGGMVGSAGDQNSAGTSGTNDNQTSSDSGSCSCRVAGENSNSRPLALMGLFGMLALLRRRKNSK